MRASIGLLASAALLVALPVLAQGTPESLLPPGFGNATTPTANDQAPDSGGNSSQQARQQSSDQQVVESDSLDDLEGEARQMPVLIELPQHARRDPAVVGRLDPASIGLTANPWGGASGTFLSPLMRRMQTPIASRWAHIALRNALLAEARAPRNVHPVDWVAERAWLLLRMGEADAARMLVAGVDVDRFTPKMLQVAVQASLATGDPSGLCPLEQGLAKAEAQVAPLVQAMCAALAGEPESASAQVDSVRRRGRISGIDLVLAEKVVGAGTDTGRAVTVEWEPVDRLSAWRFGLATATGMTFPERLTNAAPPRLRAWQARSPLLAPRDRLESAKVAAGLGVFSSQAMIDLMSLIYDSTDPDELGGTDAWQLRQAFVGRDLDTRLAAMRRLWREADGPLEVEAARAVLGRAAAGVNPDADLEADAPDLIASMLAAGYDREAARWIPVLGEMSDQNADRAWAMLALAAPGTAGLDLSIGRINSFVGRDQSEGKARSALLVAALTGLGRIDGATAGRLNARHGLGIDRRSRWTRVIDSAAGLRQPGTVLILTGTGFQTSDPEEIPASHMFHAVAALRTAGQDYIARMIAAEALART